MAHIADTMVMLQLEHVTLGGMLDLVDAVRDELDGGEGVPPELLGLLFDYFLDYPDSCHHPKEDVVMRQLQRKDPAAAARIGDLIGGHELLARLTRDTASRARTYPGGPGEESLLRALDRFTRSYREHLEAEDQHFFRTVAEVFGRDDWDLIDFTMFDQPDPLYDDRAEKRFHRLRDLIVATALADDSAGGSRGGSAVGYDDAEA